MFILALVANFLTDIYTGGSSEYWDTHKWPLAIALTITGLICLLVHQCVIKKEESRILIDKQTGKEVQLRNRHTFFFVPVLYWGPILFIISGVLVVKDLIHK